jgi:hypothetical protein
MRGAPERKDVRSLRASFYMRAKLHNVTAGEERTFIRLRASMDGDSR